MTTPARPRALHLRSAGVSLLLDLTGDRLPRVVHWGADLGDLPDDELDALLAVDVPPLSPGSTDAPVPVSVLPEQSLGRVSPDVADPRVGEFHHVIRAPEHRDEGRRLHEQRVQQPLLELGILAPDSRSAIASIDEASFTSALISR